MTIVIDNKELPRLITPNMLFVNADIRQSTWNLSSLNGSMFSQSQLSRSQFTDCNLTRNTFARVSFEKSRFTHCSLRNVTIEASDVTGLVINGVNVGNLFATKKERE